MKPTIAVAYHEDYSKYDLGAEHPFLSLKPKHIIEFLKERGLFDDKLKLFSALPVNEKDLLRVHQKDFVDRVKKLSEQGGFLSLDTPAPKGIFEIAKLACGGTKLLAEGVAQKKFWCGINLLGGFHHASKDNASGFCFFNDLAIAIEFLRAEYKNKLKKFLVIDTDVHHANGTQDIYYDDNKVMLISLHQDGRTLYPGTGFISEIGSGKGKGYTVNIPLLPGTSAKSYLYAFDAIVPKLVNQFSPDLILWQAGVDTYWRDPLANLELKLDTYYGLGLRLRALTDNTCRRLVICAGGGYNLEGSVKGCWNILSGLLKAGDFITEGELKAQRLEETKKLVGIVREKLSNYWDL